MFTNQSCKPSLNFSFSIWFCNFDGKRKKKRVILNSYAEIFRWDLRVEIPASIFPPMDKSTCPWFCPASPKTIFSIGNCLNTVG